MSRKRGETDRGLRPGYRGGGAPWFSRTANRSGSSPGPPRVHHCPCCESGESRHSGANPRRGAGGPWGQLQRAQSGEPRLGVLRNLNDRMGGPGLLPRRAATHSPQSSVPGLGQAPVCSLAFRPFPCLYDPSGHSQCPPQLLGVLICLNSLSCRVQVWPASR